MALPRTVNAEEAGGAYDFGDRTSATLTQKAWQAFGGGDHRGVELYAKKCLQLYEAEAKKQQASLTSLPPKDQAFQHWALNDVATCYLILGQSRAAQGRTEEARSAFRTIIEQFPFAQAWDGRGWLWTVADGAQDELDKLAAMAAQPNP